MSFETVADPVPAPHQVVVRNYAAALNFFDLLMIQGKYQSRPPLPFVPGAESAGVVEAVGDGVEGIGVGDRVAALPEAGAYCERSAVSASRVFPIPASMDFAVAAAMPVVYQTSMFALETRARLQAGEWLLVHAGASGVGMSAIQLGNALGARVIATAGSAAKLEYCLRQGAAYAFDYTDGSWVDRVRQLTGRGADVIYDPVGGDIFDLSTKCIAPEGRLLVIGFAGGRIPSIQTNRILLKNISVVGAIWGNYVAEHPEYLGTTQRRLFELVEAKKIRPEVSCSWPLEEAPAALRALAGRRVMGKAVLTA